VEGGKPGEGEREVKGREREEEERDGEKPGLPQNIVA